MSSLSVAPCDPENRWFQRILLSLLVLSLFGFSVSGFAQGQLVAGSNYILISNRLSEVTRVTEKQVFLNDPVELSRAAMAQHPDFRPVYGTFDANARTAVVVGVRDGDVWATQSQNATITLKKIGKAIPLNDDRIPAFEKSVLGGEAILAFECTKKRDTATSLKVILQSPEALYEVRRNRDASFAIEKIDSLQNISIVNP